MRIAAFCGLLAAFVMLAGCGDGSGAPATASAGGAAAPPPPPGGGAPPPPGGDAGAPPAEATPPPSNDTPPPGTPEGQPNPGGNPEGYVPPSDGANGAPGLPEGNPGDVNPDGTPRRPRPPARPKTIREQAIDAFRAGKDDDGYKLLYTYFAASPDAASELVQKMGWYPGLRRPSLGPRIGIAVRYVEPPPDFEGSPQPIGSAELKSGMSGFAKESEDHRIGGASARGTSRKIGARSMQARKAKAQADDANQAKAKGPGSGEEDQLDYYTGDFGTQFIDALEKRIKAGEYGAIYKELAVEIARRPARRNDPNNPNPEGASDLPPDQLPGSPDGAPGEGDRRGGQQRAQSDELGLAVVWLGKSDLREEIMKAAQEANVDLLVTYEISLAPSKINSFVMNKTRLRITSLKKEDQPLFTSATLENRAVQQERDKEKKSSKGSEDTVDREVNRAIEALDKLCKSAALPEALTPEVIKRRAAALVAEKPADPLPAVVEMRFYTAKGLLPDEDFHKAAAAMLGDVEYARMIAKSSPGMNQLVGNALNIGNLASALHGINEMTGSQAAAPKPQPASRGGLQGLLPFGFGGGNADTGDKGQPGGQAKGKGKKGKGKAPPPSN